MVATQKLQEIKPTPSTDLYTVLQARHLNRAERLDALMRHNVMTNPVVVGIVESSKAQGVYPYWIRNLHTEEGRLVGLPLIGDNQRPDIPLSSIPSSVSEGDIVSLCINVIDENKKRVFLTKPFALEPNRGMQPERLEQIPGQAIVRQGNDILIRDSLFKLAMKSLSDTITQETERLKKEHVDTTIRLEQETSRMTIEFEENKKSFLALNEAIEKAEMDRHFVDLQVEAAERKMKKAQNKKDKLMAAYQQLCDFAKDRAGLLLSLDLISNEQYDSLCGNVISGIDIPDALSWENDLGMNYGKAVSVIHSYLLSQGIIYPRWLVGNFLTLLRTNDLIILSGLSGAGKTQIVRSFAEALGGVAHVMPVKPNWTGAEDLLGFFNPLQRTYVRTPFLEALLAACRDPNRLHLICLDEMNLARAEYYFADFLSALEDRSKAAEIALYSESEASHIQSEVKMLLATLRGGGVLSTEAPSTGPSGSLESVLQQPEVMEQIRGMFGESASESFPAFHGRVRRALSTVLDIPSRMILPTNVRFIGAINVDQTTYTLSPKILDRAHVLRFENPLKYSVEEIRAEAENHMHDVPRTGPIHMSPSAFLPQRCPYPEYNSNHPAAQWLERIYHDYLIPLGLDVAFRTIRQAQLYWDLLADVIDGDASKHEAVAQNLITLQKVLPKFTIDGKTKSKFRQEADPMERWDIVREMEQDLRTVAEAADLHPNIRQELHRVRMAAEANDKIFNYWA